MAGMETTPTLRPIPMRPDPGALPSGVPCGVPSGAPSGVPPRDAPFWVAMTFAAADLAFETDAHGRLTWLAPDATLGWDAASLIGQPGARLLATGGGDAVGDPFRPDRTWRRQPVWLRHGGGGLRCLAVTATPIRDAAGEIVGARGFGWEVAADRPEMRRLRRAEALEAICRRLGAGGGGPLLPAALAAIADTLAAQGALLYAAAQGAVLARVGTPVPRGIINAATRLLAVPEAEAGAVLAGRHVDPDGRRAALITCRLAAADGSDLVALLWRTARGGADATGGARRGGEPAEWSVEEQALLGSMNGLLRLAAEDERLQHALSSGGRLDVATGLANAAAFADDAERCIERLDRDDAPGTLLLIALDDADNLGAQIGLAAWQEVLLGLASLLQATVRPTDLVARVGADTFAVWLNGADHMTAAERADQLARRAPRLLAELAEVDDPAGCPLRVSQGIACRPAGSGETIDALLARAGTALLAARDAGMRGWEVAPARAG